MECQTESRPPAQRRGLSFVEFVGCLVAMVGGVLLGSFYLGINVRTIASDVLEQAQVVAPGYFSQTATAAEGNGVDSDGLPGESESTPSEASQDLGVSDKPSPSPGNAPSEWKPGSDKQRASTPVERQTATRSYWDQMTAVMLSEAQSRLRGEGNPEEWQLYDYLLQRKQGHEAALALLRKLDRSGVDDRLLDHSGQVIAWHKAGTKLFEHALSLLSDTSGAKLSGPFAQSWQSAATQLRMEENLIVERHKAVAVYLDRHFASAGPFIPAFEQQ